MQAYTAAVDELLGLIEEGTITAFTSELTLAECLAKPFEEGRDDIVQAYEEFLTPSPLLTVLPVERDILVDTARMQALLSLRLPDAIHVATALAAGCEVVISNDKRLKVPAGLVLQPMT